MKTYFTWRTPIDYLSAATLAIFVLVQPIEGFVLFRWPANEYFRTLMLAIASSGISLLGFVLAANTFLISHTQHPRLVILRRSAGFAQLLDIMKSSLWRLFWLSVYAGLASLSVVDVSQPTLAGLTFLLVLSFIALATLIWATMSILSVPLDK